MLGNHAFFEGFLLLVIFKVWVWDHQQDSGLNPRDAGLSPLGYSRWNGKIWMFQLPFLGHVQHYLGSPRNWTSSTKTISAFPNMLQICSFTNIFTLNIPNQLDTWWLIPLSKWVITPVIGGLTLLIPFITGVITHLLSGIFRKSPATLWSCRVHHGWDAFQPFPDFELFWGSWYPKW